ncbi:valacyclovir hydrolase isoform X2 [Festucalex cinctus]
MSSSLLCGRPSLLKLRRITAAMRSCCSSLTCGRQTVNGVDLYYEKAGSGNHAVLLLPGALGSTKTDFQPQLKSLNQDLFTVVGWDPRGYGQSRPPDRDFPLDFFERDARDAVDLMRADFGLCQVFSAGVERRRDHGPDCRSQEPRIDQQDARVGIQRVCLAKGPRHLQLGPRRVQMEREDEGADGGGVRRASLCQNVASLGGRHRAVCTQTQREHLHRPSASDPMSDSDRSRRERSDGAQLSPAFPPQTYSGITTASDARRKTQSPSEVS